MKIIISDRDGKYYWKYDELGQCQCPFAKFLKRHGICAQYIMLGILQQNDIVEKCNHTYLIVRHMLY